MLLQFSRTNLVETSNSSSDSDDNKYDIVKLKQSKNSLVRLSSAIKIKKSLQWFTDHPMDENEKNLIKGVYVRKPKENLEEESKRLTLQDHIINVKVKGPKNKIKKSSTTTASYMIPTNSVIEEDPDE